MSGMWNSYRQNDLDELIERYFSCSVVVLDDFLKGTKRERGCDYEAACFLIDYLYRLKKPTILTSEFSIEKIAQFDPAMAGRITEMCNGRMIKFKNTINYRLQNK